MSESPFGQIEIHNAHIPPAPSNGLTKVETCEALFERLSRPSERHRILCGDLNTPRLETEHGEVETFASDHPEHEARWDAAERALLVGLADWDLRDVVPRPQRLRPPRRLLGDAHRARRKAAHRLDHVLASASLGAVACDYIHGWREAGLSDHSAIEAAFRPAQVARVRAPGRYGPAG